MTDDDLLTPLLAACGTLTTRALDALPPELADRLQAGALPFVVLRFAPLTAAVYAEAGAAAVKVAEVEGASIPPELDTASAVFLDWALGSLSPDAQRDVCGLLRTGHGRLALVATAWPRSVDLMLYHDAEHAERLVRVAADEGRVH